MPVCKVVSGVIIWYLHGQDTRARKLTSFQLMCLLLGVATATPLGFAGELGGRGRHWHIALCPPC